MGKKWWLISDEDVQETDVALTCAVHNAKNNFQKKLFTEALHKFNTGLYKTDQVPEEPKEDFEDVEDLYCPSCGVHLTK